MEVGNPYMLNELSFYDFIEQIVDELEMKVDKKIWPEILKHSYSKFILLGYKNNLKIDYMVDEILKREGF